MSACEWCWSEAWRREFADTRLSQTEHYYRVMDEQQNLGPNAQCPTVRDAARKAGPPAPRDVSLDP